MGREYPKDGEGRYLARVLVVEDDPILRAWLVRTVARLVAEVREAGDGATGLAGWREWQPDLVITDLLMPGLDGLEMAAAIRAEAPEAQIIMVTVSVDARHLHRALDLGIDRYVLKPVQQALLDDALHRSLGELQALRDLHLARLVFESVGEGIVVTDEAGVILAVNPAFCQVTGYREDEVLGRKPSILSSGRHDRAYYQAMWGSLESLGRWSGEIINRRKDGQHYTEWLSIVAVEEPGRRATRYVGLFSDITERKREEERIRHMAHYDVLTGLPNRVLMMDRLRRILARKERRRGELALLFLDLDRFKPVNDRYGHALGDQVLIEVARRMVANVRAGDMVCRQGGDEFVVIIEAAQAREAAAMVAAKLIDALSLPYTLHTHELSLGASVGVAIHPEDGGSAEDLLHAADQALYLAKRAGRGTFRFHRQRDQVELEDRLRFEHALLHGIAEGRFELRYLPEISLASGRVQRFEALLRFRHPSLGLLDASRFLERAERLGIMPALGMHALRTAAQALGQPGLEEIGLTLNISARQLNALDDTDALLHALADAGVAPQRIRFEFAEAAVSGNEAGLRVLYKLHGLGFACALDHYGAGFCSFGLLRQLPLAGIKIDLSFIQDLAEHRQSRDLVAALIAFARRLGLGTVAEGVDQRAQLELLRASGCDAVQGFLFGAPLTAQQLPDYLAQASWRALL